MEEDQKPEEMSVITFHLAVGLCDLCVGTFGGIDLSNMWNPHVDRQCYTGGTNLQRWVLDRSIFE